MLCPECFDAVVGWQEGQLACKNWMVGCWHGSCLGRVGDLHMAQMMPLPLTVSCSSKTRLVLPSWFYLSGAGSPGVPTPRKNTEHRKMVVVVIVWSPIPLSLHQCWWNLAQTPSREISPLSVQRVARRPYGAKKLQHHSPISLIPVLCTMCNAHGNKQCAKPNIYLRMDNSHCKTDKYLY